MVYICNIELATTCIRESKTSIFPSTAKVQSANNLSAYGIRETDAISSCFSLSGRERLVDGTRTDSVFEL